jgi:hypothetical protein
MGSACSDRADEAPIEPTDPVSARPLVAQSFYYIVSHFAVMNSTILLY